MLVKMLKVLFKNLSKQKNWKIRHCFIARGHDKFSHNPEVPQFSKTSQKAKKWWSPHALKYQLQKTFYKTCHESQSQVFHRLYVISFLHQHDEGFCSPFKKQETDAQRGLSICPNSNNSVIMTPSLFFQLLPDTVSHTDTVSHIDTVSYIIYFPFCLHFWTLLGFLWFYLVSPMRRPVLDSQLFRE